MAFYFLTLRASLLNYLGPSKVKGGGKRGHIVADTFLMVFLGWTNEREKTFFLCCANQETFRAQNLSLRNQKCLCLGHKFNFVSATNVARGNRN